MISSVQSLSNNTYLYSGKRNINKNVSKFKNRDNTSNTSIPNDLLRVYFTGSLSLKKLTRQISPEVKKVIDQYCSDTSSDWIGKTKVIRQTQDDSNKQIEDAFIVMRDTLFPQDIDKYPEIDLIDTKGQRIGYSCICRDDNIDIMLPYADDGRDALYCVFMRNMKPDEYSDVGTAIHETLVALANKYDLKGIILDSYPEKVDFHKKCGFIQYRKADGRVPMYLPENRFDELKKKLDKNPILF